MSFFVGFFQFFVLSTLIFYLKVPITLGGWLVVYIIHLLVTLLLLKFIPVNSVANNKNFYGFNRLFYFCLGLVGIILTLYLFETIRQTEILYDSCFYYFVKGWTFYHIPDIYIFPYLHGNSYPLLIPLIYNFFINLKSGLGIGGYAGLLVIASILLTVVRGWYVLGNYSVIFAIPFSMVLPTFLGRDIHLSYADIPLSVVCYVALLTLLDVLYEKKSIYPAMILLLAIPMIKINGQYIVLLVFLTFFIFCYFTYKIFKDAIITSIKIFLPVLVFLFANYLLLDYFRVRSLSGNVALSVLREEIFGTGNPFVAYWDKLIPSIKCFRGLVTSSHYSPYFFFLLSTPFFFLMDRKGRFLFINISMVMVFIVCAVYVLVPNKERDWWFTYGYHRMISHIGVSVIGFLYLLVIDFCNICLETKRKNKVH